jgi:hypothetical protein
MHKQVIIVASALILAATTSAPAWARWGCGAESTNGAQGRTWSWGSRAGAARTAMDICRREGGGDQCHIVGCSDNVSTEAQAARLWIPTTSDNYFRCGADTGTKC